VNGPSCHFVLIVPYIPFPANNPGRKLPDKAIDLMDEACANVRVDLDSRPQALDQVGVWARVW
jgi:hypothetical protein